MSSPKSNVDVLVVGAGPVGLVAALVLAQNGVSIRIIDKVDNFDNIGQRGAGLQPRSLEAYKFLGVLDTFVEKGTFEVWNIRSYDAEGKIANESPFWSKPPATPEIPFSSPMTLGQDKNCAILREHLSKLGVHVEVSTEMMSYEQDKDGVTASLNIKGSEEKVRAKFLLGTDGGKGPTRRTAGINFVGQTKEINAVIGDVELSGLDVSSSQIMHHFTDSSKNRLLIRPIPEDPTASFIFFVSAVPNMDMHRFMSDKSFMQDKLRILSHRPDLVVSKIRNVAEWRLNERVADRLKVARVLIAGDAAHCHSPSGGQGLNSGVLDATNVAWKLASVLKHNSPLTLLDTYEEERLPVIREMLRLTTDMADKSFKTTDTSTTMWQRPLSLRQLGVHCRWSGIVLDELSVQEERAVTGTSVEPEDVYGKDTSERLRAGDRAPDAPGLVDCKGASTELFEIFKATYHTIVALDAEALKDIQALRGVYPKGSVRIIAALPEGHAVEGADLYTDSQGHARRVYGVQAGVKVVIVRPDGVVGGLLKGAEGIQKYFSRIFV